MSTNEIMPKEEEINESSKLKLIIISKKGKLDKSNEGTVITLKNDEGRMELRMDNLSENITKNKIDKTLKSFMFNKSISDFKIKNKNFVIIDKQSNNLSEREKCIKSNNIENNKNDEIYIENHPIRIVEKLKKIGSINDFHDKLKVYESQKKDNNDSDENNDTNNNKNNIINNNTNIGENSEKDDGIIFVNNKNDTNDINENIINKKINKEISDIQGNAIKNFEEMDTFHKLFYIYIY